MRIHLWTALIISALFAAATSSRLAISAQSGNNRERTLFVSAVDEKGEPVEGLGADAFIVREEGRRREILRVSRATEPIDLALLVDNSQAATDEITFIRDGLSRFVSTMGSEHRIALITLADRPTVVVPYTTDTGALTKAIGRLFQQTGSGMTLLDGLWETSRGLRRREGARAVFVPLVTLFGWLAGFILPASTPWPLQAAAVTAVVVPVMIFLAAPRLTRLFRSWLNPAD